MITWTEEAKRKKEAKRTKRAKGEKSARWPPPHG
jgi:hypothetical protein